MLTLFSFQFIVSSGTKLHFQPPEFDPLQYENTEGEIWSHVMSGRHTGCNAWYQICKVHCCTLTLGMYSPLQVVSCLNLWEMTWKWHTTAPHLSTLSLPDVIHRTRSIRPFPSIIACCKWSKAGGAEVLESVVFSCPWPFHCLRDHVLQTHFLNSVVTRPYSHLR